MDSSVYSRKKREQGKHFSLQHSTEPKFSLQLPNVPEEADFAI